MPRAPRSSRTRGPRRARRTAGRSSDRTASRKGRFQWYRACDPPRRPGLQGDAPTAISSRMANTTADILLANDAFYAAFADRDDEAMDALWARGALVACVHPGWPPLVGRDAVMASWRGILRGPGAPTIACTDATCH